MAWKRIVLRVMCFAFRACLWKCFHRIGAGYYTRRLGPEGDCSLWMLPIYGLLGIFVAPVSGRLQQWRIPLFLRAALYMAFIFLVEYLFGALFDWAGLEIWNYSKRALNLHGYITLTYAPFWYFLGLWLEFLNRKFDACATAWAYGHSADTLISHRQDL